MIENLNKESFSAFGTILRDSLPNRGFPDTADYCESIRSIAAGPAGYLRAPGGAYLDFEEGMSVLAVRADGVCACFYLDKPVFLPPETDFAVLPYQEHCAVRLALPTDAPLLSLSDAVSAENLKTIDRLLLGEIYTIFYREEESGFLFKGEQHSMYELTYVDRGQLHCVVDGSGYLLRQGQLMLFAPHQWHMQYTDLDVTARFLTIAFDLSGEQMPPLADRVNELSAEEAVYLRRIIQESTRRDYYSGDIIRGNLKLLLLSLLRESAGGRRPLQAAPTLRVENDLVNRTLRYVADHVYEKLSVESVAAEIGVSTSHLTALFRRQMKISPGEYIRRVKLEESKCLIREGELNLSKIAETLKYSTIHHFSRQFKDTFGISPSEYAKSLRSSDA